MSASSGGSSSGGGCFLLCFLTAASCMFFGLGATLTIIKWVVYALGAIGAVMIVCLIVAPFRDGAAYRRRLREQAAQAAAREDAIEAELQSMIDQGRGA